MKTPVLSALLFLTSAAAAVELWPDYANITLPPNIAPLNFDVKDAPADATVVLSNGSETYTSGLNVRIPEATWRKLIAAPSYTITVKQGEKTLFSATNTVAQEPIDQVLVYRLIPPSYENFTNVGLYWRDLTSFDEHPFYTNLQSSPKQCVNCHTFKQNDPETFLFHLRAYNAGTVIYNGPGDPGVKRNFKVGKLISSGVYPAWHPSGQFIAFSMNETFQCFYYANRDKIEVMDARSDMALYDLATDEVIPVETDSTLFDCFPTWSPDGRTLYSVAARAPYDLPEDSVERSFLASTNYAQLRYNLIARDFDPITRTFSEPRTVLDAAKDNTSITHPRVSPDGRWLIFTLGPQGVFHIWHKTADLWLLDLQTNRFRALAEINSPETESFHNFSHDGAWMVFSSRRDDGTYTRPYFAHFNTITGTFAKPFLLPQREPVEHLQRMLSYNVPELITAPPKRSPRDIRKLADEPAQNAKLAPEQP